MAQNSNRRLSLVEMLEHLKELSDAGFRNQAFQHTAFDELIKEILLREKLSDLYIAIGYLKTLEKGNEGINGLNVEELKEILQNRVNFLKSKKETPKHPVLVDAHMVQMLDLLS